MWSDALEETAREWSDPELPARAEAVDDLLAGDVRFTEESVAFALNHAMATIAEGVLADWLGPAGTPAPATIAVLARTRTPAEGLLEVASASLRAHRVVVAGASPVVEAFFESVGEKGDSERVRQVERHDALSHADAFLVLGASTDPDAGVESDAEQNAPDLPGLGVRDRLGIAVMAGSEDHRALSGLAEDMLLHEGGMPQNVRIVLAPAGHSPDPLLSAMAGFREVFPPHPTTDGSLALSAAFLEAMHTPVAIGPGFLLSKGELEPQAGAHIRWVDYDDPADAVRMLSAMPGDELFVACSDAVLSSLVAAGLPEETMRLDLGDAHRPVPGQPPMTDSLRAFLAGLSQTG